MRRYRASFLSVFVSESSYQVSETKKILNKVAVKVTLWRFLNNLRNHVRSSQQQQLFDILTFFKNVLLEQELEDDCNVV